MNGTEETEAVDNNVFDDATTDNASQTDSAQNTQSDATQQAQQQQQTPPAFDASVIAKAVQEGMRQALPQQTQAPRQLTQEEINKQLKVYQYGEDYADALIKELRADEPDKKAIAALLNASHAAAMEQAQTYATLLANALKQELIQQVQPAVQFATESQRKASEERFFTQYPSLKQFGTLMPVIAQQLQMSGQQFNNEADAFKALATMAEQQIKAYNPTFSLGQQTQAQTQGATKPNTVSFGGQGGGGNTQTTKKSGASDIW